ncbi:MAG: hypothetical protein H6745_29040 [Deltaproteobacteria bacterium]|nr:hypothetical protein [Deltaproteobacteria bacterium]
MLPDDSPPAAPNRDSAATGRARRALAALVVAVLAASCASSQKPARPPEKPTLTVINASDDSWEILAVGAVRGTAQPRSELVVRGLPTGDLVIVARNQRLRLRQETEVTLKPGDQGRWAIATPAAQLRVVNQRPSGAEIVIDGRPFGWARPLAETVFDGVPAGQRTLVARSADGPAALQTDLYLLPGEETAWTVTPAVGAAGGAPTPPRGMGLVWARNGGNVPIRVVVGGTLRAEMKPGERASIVLPPGTWELVVQLEGISAETHHMVTLLPNQVADWSWGGP